MQYLENECSRCLSRRRNVSFCNMCVAKGRTYVVGGIRDSKAVWLDSNGLSESDSVVILMLRKKKDTDMQTHHRGNNACN